MSTTNWRFIAVTVTALAAFLAAALACGQSPQPEWASDFKKPGLWGRVFGLTSWDGRLIAAGSGFHADGQVVNRITSYDGNRWTALGTGLSGGLLPGVNGPYARAVVEFNGDLVVGGCFENAGGVTAYSIARWDGTQWHALGQGLRSTTTFTATVFALAVYQGELYAGGDFQLAGGQATPALAKWNGGQWSAVGGGIGGSAEPRIESLAVHQNVLYVGGAFPQAGGITVDNLGAWNGAAWSAVGGGIPGPYGTAVQAIKSFQGEIYVGGTFYGFSGLTVNHVAKWNGVAWSAVGGGVTSTIGIGSNVDCFEEYGGSLYVGGMFDVVGAAQQQSWRVARWDGAQWHAVGGILSPVVATFALAMTVYQGRLVVGGEFDRAAPAFPDGSPVVTESVASFDGTTWGLVGSGLGTDERVEKLLAWNGGIVATGMFTTCGMLYTSTVAFFDGFQWRKIGVFDHNVHDAVVFNGDLVVTGDFSTVNGQGAAGIARFDGVQWYPFGGGAGGHSVAVYQGQLYAGGIGPPKRWTGTAWQTFGPAMYGAVGAMHAHNGILYIGGTIGGAGPNFVSWDGVTLASIGANGAVESFATFGPDLIVGGSFTTLGGASIARIGRWDGVAWSQLGPGLPAGVMALEPHFGELYVGGGFSMFMGAAGNYVVKWNGASFQPLGSGLDGAVYTLLSDPTRGSVYAGGWFHQAGAKPSWGVARWGPPTLGLSLSQTAPGSQVTLVHANLTPGRQYYDVFSFEPAPAGPGTGPFAGLWSSNLNVLVDQILSGIPPFSYVATSTTMTFGPFPVPPMEVDSILFEVNSSFLDSTSFAQRLTIR